MVNPPVPQELADLLGQAGDAEFLAVAGQAITTVRALAYSYTRGMGFADGQVAEDIGAVLLMAAARFVNNPEAHKREQLGDWQVTPSPFVGWSLVELAVLNRYRERAR